MRRTLLLLLVLTGFAMTAFAQADPPAQTEDRDFHKSYLYQWTDDKGVVHIADGLGKVPKQHRDKAIKLTQPKKEGVYQSHQEQGYFPRAGEDEAAKAAWRQRMREARQRLAGAEGRYQQLDQRRNALLRNWGADAFGRRTDRIEAEKIEQEMQEAQKEIDEARHAIDVVIPDEARREGVPPGWLRE